MFLTNGSDNLIIKDTYSKQAVWVKTTSSNSNCVNEFATFYVAFGPRRQLVAPKGWKGVHLSTKLHARIGTRVKIGHPVGSHAFITLESVCELLLCGSSFLNLSKSYIFTFDSRIKFYNAILSYSLHLMQIHENRKFVISIGEGEFLDIRIDLNF